MQTSLGVDPGRRGAAYVVDLQRIHDGIEWRPRTRAGVRVYEVTRHSSGVSVIVPTVAAIGLCVADLASEHAIDLGTCEGQGVPRGRGGSRASVGSILTLARLAGELSGPTRAALGVEDWWYPTAWEWRPLVGIAPSTRAADAKLRAVDLVRGWYGVELSADAAEAVCIARARLARLVGE